MRFIAIAALVSTIQLTPAITKQATPDNYGILAVLNVFDQIYGGGKHTLLTHAGDPKAGAILTRGKNSWLVKSREGTPCTYDLLPAVLPTPEELNKPETRFSELQASGSAVASIAFNELTDEYVERPASAYGDVEIVVTGFPGAQCDIANRQHTRQCYKGLVATLKADDAPSLLRSLRFIFINVCSHKPDQPL